MVTVTQDPTNPERLVLSITLTTYLDKLLLQTLSDEVTNAIRAQAVKDLSSNSAVKKLIAKAATAKLLTMLGAEAGAEVAPDAQ
jgi:hypothetical protein